MTLTNYWFSLIWIFPGGLFCSTITRERILVLGKFEKRWDRQEDVTCKSSLIKKIVKKTYTVITR